ncbi:MAG: RagB/SusD family nutrient uptake outer membrane protein, partial [Bacteroidales bacterium]|nr:RagB/SusD family nutrient uptake outer membrane protein [Bacteroidales bacterium]
TTGSPTATNIVIATSQAPLTWSLTEGDHGYLVYNNDSQWEEKYYTSPLPQSAMNVNPKLEQNILWK